MLFDEISGRKASASLNSVGLLEVSRYGETFAEPVPG